MIGCGQCISLFFRILVEVKNLLGDRDAMRKQAEGVKTEYDRLAEEYQKLQVG